MSEELKRNLIKRLKSLGWRTGCFAIVGLIAIILDNLAGLELPPVAVAVIGLVLGELTKAINNNLNKFGSAKR